MDGDGTTDGPVQSSPRGAISALLPIKITGEHHGDNLARLDLLLSSMLHFAEPGLLEEFLIVARGDEADHIRSYLEHWPQLPLRLIVEEEHFSAFRRYTRPWQMRSWQRQQIIKLNAPAFTSSPFVLMLDPDMMAMKRITRDLLLPGGRGLMDPEPRSVHRQWYIDSAGILDWSPALDHLGMNVTPAVLSTDLLKKVHERIEAANGRPWMDVLLTSYCNWTEYTLYLLTADNTGLFDHYHLWSDNPAAVTRLQIDPALSIWVTAAASKANLERLFAAEEPGLFAVVQSRSGLPVDVIAPVAGGRFEVRRTPVTEIPIAAAPSALRERLTTTSRLVAQKIYRLRRRFK
jgi:hypothetical protein